VIELARAPVRRHVGIPQQLLEQVAIGLVRRRRDHVRVQVADELARNFFPVADDLAQIGRIEELPQDVGVRAVAAE
jgi:hypothetical protein